MLPASVWDLRGAAWSTSHLGPIHSLCATGLSGNVAGGNSPVNDSSPDSKAAQNAVRSLGHLPDAGVASTFLADPCTGIGGKSLRFAPARRSSDQSLARVEARCRVRDANAGAAGAHQQRPARGFGWTGKRGKRAGKRGAESAGSGVTGGGLPGRSLRTAATGVSVDPGGRRHPALWAQLMPRLHARARRTPRQLLPPWRVHARGRGSVAYGPGIPSGNDFPGGSPDGRRGRVHLGRGKDRSQREILTKIQSGSTKTTTETPYAPAQAL